MQSIRPYRAEGIGSFGGSALAKLKPKIIAVGVHDRFNAYGGRDFNTTTTPLHQGNVLPGAVNLNHSPRHTTLAAGFKNDRSVAVEKRTEWYDGIIAMGDLAQAATRGSGLIDDFAIYFAGLSGGHLEVFLRRLHDQRRRAPGGTSSQVWVTTLSDEFGPRDRIRHHPDLPAHVQDTGLVDITLMLDNAGPIARDPARGRDFLDDLWTTGVASFLKAPFLPMELAQRAPSDIFHELARLSSLCTLSFGVEHLAGAGETALSKLFKGTWGGTPRTRVDDPVTVAAACIRAAETALRDPSWRALDEAPHEGLPAFCAFTVPVPLARRRDYEAFWKPLSSMVNAWCTRDAPWVTAVFVPGSGVPIPELARGRPYWVQATLAHAIPAWPAPIREILARPPLATLLQQPPSEARVSAFEEERPPTVHRIVRRYRRITGPDMREEASS